MRQLTATTRVTIGLVCLSVSIWLLAATLGFVPDRRHAVTEGRAKLCEAVAINCSLLAGKGDLKRMEAGMIALAERNPDVVSAAIRRADGSLAVDINEHRKHWSIAAGEHSNSTHMQVPVMAGEQFWGTVEVRFRDAPKSAWFAWLAHPLIKLMVFVACASYLMYFFYLRKMLAHLDPSKVIPHRVRATLDTLAEGLLVLDKNERIILANRAFAETVGRTADELVGRRAADLPWTIQAEQPTDAAYPWSKAIREGERQIGNMLVMGGNGSDQRIFKVNASPILGGRGEYRGALASFDDVTIIEQNRADLQKMLDTLSTSRDEIRRQNEALERLATIDPLTNCLNRRSFFRDLETNWSNAQRHGHPLSCLLVDIDYFKSINDTHGHSVGDMVLQKVSEILRSGRRDCDLVCRYGGEEFCILLPFTDLDDAYAVAEKCRQAIETTPFNGLSITASVGVSSRSLEPRDPQELIDQADKALYAAKRGGRNRVVSWNEVPADEADDFAKNDTASRRDSVAHGGQNGKPKAMTLDLTDAMEDPAIPFHAVTALHSALAYRDASTAEHSRRVADLCVATAAGLMSIRDSYILEIAALLHDIGKIGVPDSILLKPGPLTQEEWKVMSIHDHVGVEIVQSTFTSPRLAEIVASHHAWYDGNPRDADLPKGEDIPLGARILAICDAYDAIVSDRVYRKGRSQEEAFTELRRCADKQFDPDLVERFIEVVEARNNTHATSAPDSSKAAALSYGMQIERMTDALERNDIDSLAALASRLNMTATKYNETNIADIAAELQSAASADDADLKMLVELTSDLLNHCRSAQRAYLDQCHAPGVSREG